MTGFKDKRNEEIGHCGQTIFNRVQAKGNNKPCKQADHNVIRLLKFRWGFALYPKYSKRPNPVESLLRCGYAAIPQS